LNWARHIGFSITLLTIFNQCTGTNAPECASALGDIIVESRKLKSFNRLNLSGRLNINLIQDSSNYVEVIFGEGLTDGIKTSVNNGTLKISEENSCDWIRDQQVNPVLNIHYDHLDKIINQGSGSLIFENAHTTGKLSLEVSDVAGSVDIKFEGDSLSVLAHTGATDIGISGVTHFAYFYNSSYAPINAKNLISEVSVPHNNHTGDIIVNVSERLSYQIFDDGDIIVYGNPKIIQKWADEGNGEIIQKN
jgi:hypothetical protein